MSIEMETMWDAMKQAHYKRTLEKLENGIKNAVNPKEAMEAALNEVVEAIHAEAGTFWFFDRFGEFLIIPTAVYGGSSMEGITLTPYEGVAGKVIESGESTIIPDCQQDSRWAGKVDKKTGFQTKSMICVPLKLDRSVCFGSIQIINKKDGLPFDNLDLEFTEKLAEAAGGMLAEQEMLRAYRVYTGRAMEDTITFESIMCAPTLREMQRITDKTNCWQFLNRQEKEEAEKMLKQLHGLFEEALSRKEELGEEQPKKKGLFGRKK